MANKPNFLILMADQLTARALPAYGNRFAKTPHIDALAANGVVFGGEPLTGPLPANHRYMIYFDIRRPEASAAELEKKQ